MPRDEDNSRWWPVLYVGKNAKKDEEGAYVWKFRDELAEALKRIDLSQVKLYANLKPSFWKISHGNDCINDDEVNAFEKRKVIVSDEDSNKDMIPLLKEHFETVVVPRSGFYNTNRMHNKFCIIDLEYVMHGSYNWTKAANYNGETLVTSVDRELVKKFATEFNETIVENS